MRLELRDEQFKSVEWHKRIIIMHVPRSRGRSHWKPANVRGEKGGWRYRQEAEPTGLGGPDQDMSSPCDVGAIGAFRQRGSLESKTQPAAGQMKRGPDGHGLISLTSTL